MKRTNLQKKLALIMGAIMLCLCLCPAYAATDALGAVNNIATLLFSISRVLGVIFLIWGIVQLALAVQQHDPSQRSNAILSLVGGILVFFVKEIIDLITG